MLDEDGDFKPPSQFWDLGVIAIAAVFTSCIVGLWFFNFKVPADKPPSEISIGIGQGATIRPPVQPVSSDIRPSPPGKLQKQP